MSWLAGREERKKRQSGEEKLYSDKSAEKTQLDKTNRTEEAADKPSALEPTCNTFPGVP